MATIGLAGSSKNWVKLGGGRHGMKTLMEKSLRVKGGIRPHSLPIFNFSELCGENDQNKLGRIYT